MKYNDAMEKVKHKNNKSFKEKNINFNKEKHTNN